MKIVENVLLIIAVLSALLGLLKILPYEITNPIMLIASATSLILRSLADWKNERNIITILVALFMIVGAIYIVIR